jgi:transcriptional regulator with XRE-family HTH domain
MASLQEIFVINLRKYRKQAELTQEKLAELCDMNPRYIGQIETGLRFPSVDSIEKIADALDISPYQLFYDEIEEKEAQEEKIAAVHKEQKQKIKTILVESVSRICAVIDELY